MIQDLLQCCVFYVVICHHVPCNQILTPFRGPRCVKINRNGSIFTALFVFKILQTDPSIAGLFFHLHIVEQQKCLNIFSNVTLRIFFGYCVIPEHYFEKKRKKELIYNFFYFSVPEPLLC